MFKRNPGRLRHYVTLLKPAAPARDVLGGLTPTTYTAVLTVPAMREVRSQSRQQVEGDYVTIDTRYFVMRDLSGTAAADINTAWRLESDGVVYIINNVECIDESVPAWVQVTATARTQGGA